MASTTHEFSVEVEWKGGREGSGASKFLTSDVSFPLAVPPEFGGPGGACNPEELLTGAVSSCYAITFGIVAANRKLPVIDIKVNSCGEVEQAGASFSYKKIWIRPSITVSAEATDEQIASTLEMAHKADQYCIVTNAIRGKVVVGVEPEVKRASGA